MQICPIIGNLYTAGLITSPFCGEKANLQVTVNPAIFNKRIPEEDHLLLIILMTGTLSKKSCCSKLSNIGEIDNGGTFLI